MNVAILVPYRPDGGHRDRLWRFVKRRWEKDYPDWPVFLGSSPDGPFNRSAAINHAAEQAGAWDVAVVADADVIFGDSSCVADAVAKAHGGGKLVITHTQRVDLSRVGTEKVLAGFEGPWHRRPVMERIWSTSDSSCIAIPRRLWDKVGGFDERFKGWGYEDTAFVIACERAAGVVKLRGSVFHLWHERPADGAKNSPTRAANLALLEALRSAPVDDGLIPRIFHRTLPEAVDPQLEEWWEQRRTLHPTWEFRTYRDPIDPGLFPRTSPLWDRCETGAQKADLIRLEALVQWGGVYVDSDCRPVSSFEPLRCAPAFAAWEDETTIPNAVMGSRPGHPAMVEALNRSVMGVRRRRKTYDTGVAVTTAVFRTRTDMLLLPPGAFYPHHYLEKNQAGRKTGPWTIEEHMWHHSWGDDTSKASIEERQRA